jgi:multicomponent Na+:H+ antiporter subunit C
MSWLLALAMTTVLAAGLFLALSRSVLRIAIGISLIGSAINVLIFASGRLARGPRR